MPVATGGASLPQKAHETHGLFAEPHDLCALAETTPVVGSSGLLCLLVRDCLDSPPLPVVHNCIGAYTVIPCGAR
jgi:hypothetical protein